MTSPACINMADMKPSLFRIVLICPAVAMGLAACSPSPYYTGSKSLAPGAVPRDGLGRPVIDGEALVYDLPPPAPRISSDITGRPAVSSNANRNIYFEDLGYSDRKRAVWGKSGSVRVKLGGPRFN